MYGQMPKLYFLIIHMENKLTHQTFKDYSILFGPRIFIYFTDAHMHILNTDSS
jgi:hypothetical protein